VSGEAGAGKSSLVEQFAQQAGRAARVLWGHCDALQTSRVLGPVNEVVAGLALVQRESLEILEHLGAGPLAAIVRQRLRGLGARGIPRGPRASTRDNPAGLTAREVQVLTLLVRGHTNNELAQRLHVSAKTIDHHVSSILEKLAVRSRTEAVTAAFELGIATAAD
jgi:DNA-binding NarL/FixJ family response regulator